MDPKIPIPGFDGYFVTHSGKIYGRHGRQLALHLDKDGYFRVSMAAERGAESKRLKRGVHQIVCLVWHGPAPSEKHEVRHLDGNRRNNIPDNLAWATRQENSDDRFIHGTVPLGSKHGMAKLSEYDVRIIKWLLAVGLSSKEQIAGFFGVSSRTIDFIKNGSTWKHVPEVNYAYPSA